MRGSQSDSPCSGVLRLAGLTLFTSVGDFIFGAVYVTIMLNAGFTPKTVGTLFFIAFVISTVFEIPSGDWGDRYGHRTIATIGLIVWGSALVAFQIALHIKILMVLVLTLWSIGQALYSGAPLALTLNSIPEEEKSTRQAAVRCANVAKWFGAALGAGLVVLGAIKLDSVSLVTLAGFTLLILSAWMRLTWNDSLQLSQNDRTGANLAWRLSKSWSREMTFLLLISAVVALTLSILLFAWQPLVSMVLDADERFNGVILLCMTILAGVGAYLSKFESVLPKHASYFAPIVISGLLFVLIGAIPNLCSVFLAIGVVEMLLGYANTVVAIRAHDLFPDSARNLLWSVFSASIGISMAFSDLLFGLLWNGRGITQALQVSGALIVTIAISIGILRRKVS